MDGGRGLRMISIHSAGVIDRITKATIRSRRCCVARFVNVPERLKIPPSFGALRRAWNSIFFM
jgi:hypothetical protein